VSAATASAPVTALAGFLAVILAQRIAELLVSARNARRVRSRGAIEPRADRFPWIVAIHVLFPVALAVEVAALGARPGGFAAFWAVAWLAAQGLRYWAMWALGDRWNVRVLVVPGEPPVRRGPYRWLRHPNYLAVAIELFAGPLIFGAWRTALVFTLLNLLVLSRRVRIEERALAEAASR
jgi:methyltransferase